MYASSLTFSHYCKSLCFFLIEAFSTVCGLIVLISEHTWSWKYACLFSSSGTEVNLNRK
jgi:hypothetical protein